MSGAAPGRGLELLVDAVALARASVPDLVLRMWLVAPGEASEVYLEELRSSLAGRDWVSISTAAYERLGETIGEASILAIPHPPNDYMDVALPVKLFDSLAAGRPVLVTPRRETAAVVERHGVGWVTRGDGAQEVAATIVDAFADVSELMARGTRARQVAETIYDWRVVGDAIADEVLRREGV